MVKRLPNGTIYCYDTYSTTDSKNSTYGVKLRGDDRIYNIVLNGHVDISYLLMSLSKKGPKELAEIYKKYFNDENHCKELVEDPTLIIRLYDNYLKTNQAIVRTSK